MEKRTIRTGLYNRYDRIYIDTSTLMNYESLKLFLDRNRSCGLRIIMTRAVRLELAKHIDVGIPEKANRSLECIRIMDEHPGLIVLEGGVLSEDLMYSTHADREILAMLTRDKDRYRQLLITNDSDLAADALTLNRQLSCPGMEVSVRRINRFGEMRPFNEKRLFSSVQQATISHDSSQECAVEIGKADIEATKDAIPIMSPVEESPDINVSHSGSAMTEKATDLSEDFVSVPAAVATHPKKSETFAAPSDTNVPLCVLGMVLAGIVGAFVGATAVIVQPQTGMNAPRTGCV